jgi:hypothetical protein
MEIHKLETENQLELQRMQQRFFYDKQLKEMDMQAIGAKEQMIEDRKDKRIKMEGTQQSKMITQRQNEMMPINFEQEAQDQPIV